MHVISIPSQLAEVSEPWRPRVIARLNEQEVKVVRLLGEFPWHHHDDVEELFMVWRGCLRLEFRDRVLTLSPGEMAVVPRGVEHRPVATSEVEVLLFEPAGVRNTGNVVDLRFSAPSEAFG